MKKVYLLVFASIIFTISAYSQAAFTKGNLVVYTIGNGTDTLSSAPAVVSLDEYTPAGTFVQSHPLPTTIIGSNKRMVASGSATSEGQITRSVDKQFILATGYDTFPDPTRLSIATSTTANVKRVVGIMDANGILDATTALTDAFSTNNIRGVASINGTDIWVAGTGTSATSGVRATTKGSSTSTEISTTVTNIRTVNIFNGQLYSTSQSKTFFGICADGSGLPTTTGQTITLLPGFPSATANPYAFSIDPTGTIAYVADDNAVSSSGGIQKWTSNGTTWTMAYVLNSGLTDGIRNIVVDWSGTNPFIYATSGESPNSNLPGNRIITVTDAGVSSSFTTLATAGVNKIFRGISFAPETIVVPVTLINFQAVPIASGVQLQWETSSEINTKQFEIERSSDGINFTSISKTAATGNSSTLRNYQSIDNNPIDGISYYRLKTIDNNGVFSYSKIASINYSQKNLSVFPNPTIDEVTIQHPTSNNATIIINDLQGRKIREINIAAGNTSSKISVKELSNGQYIINYNDNGYTKRNMLTKQ